MEKHTENVSILKNESEKLKQYIATCSVALGAVCAGTVLAWTSPVLPQIQLPENITNSSNIDDAALQLTETQCGTVGSMLALGATLSSIPGGFLADKFGRKYTILSLSIPFTLNWILTVFASSAMMLYTGRFLAGLAVGAICVTAPMYIGEIAESSIRGTLGSFFQMFICAGILLTYVVGAFLPWRQLSIALGAMPILFVICFSRMPETPTYLLKKGDKKGAVEALKLLRGEKYNHNVEIESLEEALAESQAKSAKLSDLVASRGNRKALISGLMIMVFQQFSGINAVIFYTVPIFKSAGSSLSPDLSAILVGVVQLIVAYIAAMVIDKAARRFFLMFSSMGMALCLAALGLYFHLQSMEISNSFLNVLPVGSLLLFIVAFSFGFGPVPWMVMGELFAPEIKGLASGLAVMTNWIMVFIVTFMFPIMNSELGGHVTFYFFSIIMVLAFVFVLTYMPETKGKSLQEIQRILNK